MIGGEDMLNLPQHIILLQGSGYSIQLSLKIGWATTHEFCGVLVPVTGVGKTQLMSLIIDHLSKTRSKVSYFYCDYRTSGHKSITTEIAAAILRQLVEDEPTIPPALMDLYRDLNGGRKKLKLDDMTTLIKHICLTRPDCFIVLEALDECNSQRKQVLQLLRKIADASGRVLVSSRPHIREIARAFDSYSQLEIKTHSSDIRTFVDDMINTSSELSDLIPRDLRQEIVQRVTDQSSPMFLISALQCNRLVHASRLSEIRKAVCELPMGLNDLYKESMDRIELEPSGRRSIAMRALSWIYHSKRQLSTEELIHALSIEPHEDIPLYEDVVSQRVVLDVCAGLVVINPEHDTFRFVHQSLHEYFARTSEDWFPRARLEITRACLTYLRFLSPEKGIADSVSSHPFLKYAAQYWGGHARDEYSESLDSIVLAVFQNQSTVTMASVILDNEQSGEDVPLMSSSPNIAIQLSARLGALQILNILIRNGLQLNGADSGGRTAIHWAARGGFVDVVRCLLQSGVEASLRTEKLLSVADPDEITVDGRTALHWASSRGHLSVVKLLLSDERVDVARQCQRGWTALHWAACSGNRAVAARAIQRNIDSSKGPAGLPPDSFSMNGGESQRHEQVINLLLDSGANPNAQNKDQQTALHWAAASGNARIVRMLLEHGADMGVRDVHGFTPWYFAKENGVDDVVIRMLDTSEDDSVVVG
ncbi:ankyrin repeat-containing domain protein [Hypoxylon cercidicola]|nr:ankyrin repeat-containing domain protein [Hypoxylon cercidicola]